MEIPANMTLDEIWILIPSATKNTWNTAYKPESLEFVRKRCFDYYASSANRPKNIMEWGRAFEFFFKKDCISKIPPTLPAASDESSTTKAGRISELRDLERRAWARLKEMAKQVNCPRCIGNGTVGVLRPPDHKYSYVFYCSCELGDLAMEIPEHKNTIKSRWSDEKQSEGWILD